MTVPDVSVRSVGYALAKWAPTFLLGVLIAFSLAYSNFRGGIEIVVVLGFVVLQLLWIGLWYGVPWAAQKIGKTVSA